MYNEKKRFGIEHLCVSFIWTRTFFNFLQLDNEFNPQIKFFLSFAEYKKYFKELRQLQKEGRNAMELSLPWRVDDEIKFWKYQFGGKAPLDLSPDDMFEKNMVPFRKSLKKKISCTDRDILKSLSLEGFYYRHGVALVITIRVQESKLLIDAVNKVREARFAPIYYIKENDYLKDPYKLGQLADQLLDSLCQDALGAGKESSLSGHYDPFSVATVIKGDCSYDQPIEENKDIRRALESLTKWKKVNTNQTLHPLDENRLDISNNGYANRFLYSNKQGRAVWFPDLFTSSALNIKIGHELSFYHRNLVLASLYTASLGNFIFYTANEMKKNVMLSEYHKIWASAAINILERMYYNKNEANKNNKYTHSYKTMSARRYIDDNKIKDDMEYVIARI